MPGYVRQTWVDDDPTRPLSDARMDHLEEGIEMVDQDVQAEAVTRAAADTAEVTNRNNAISAAVATEVTNRNSAIASEASTRASADTALDSRVDVLEAAAAGMAWKAWRLTAQHTDSANTYDPLSIGTIAIDANATYEYVLELIVSFSISACNGNFRLTDGAATVADAHGHHVLPAGGNPGVDGNFEQASSPFATWGPTPGTNPGAGVVHRVKSEGRFTVGGTAGTLGVEARISTTTGGGVMTVYTASRLYLLKVVTEN